MFRAMGFDDDQSSSLISVTDPTADATPCNVNLAVEVVREDRRPSDVPTRESVENAIAVQAATGGSTGGVLHLLAMACGAGIDLELTDFDPAANGAVTNSGCSDRQ